MQENYRRSHFSLPRSLRGASRFFPALLLLSTQFVVASFIVGRENCLQLNYNDFVRHRETK